METRIVKDKISRDELKTLAHEQYGDIIKAVVDINQEIMGVGRELHIDIQSLLIEKENWRTLTLVEQLGNIRSEVGRAAKWQGKDENSFWGAVTRALELFDLTRADRRWKKRQVEIDRAKEVFSDAVLGGQEYNSF